MAPSESLQPSFGTIAILVGLAAEARLARPLGLPIAIGGGTAAGARAAAERLIRDGATGIISFGLAGGLDPALRPGTIVVPRTMIVDGRWVATDAALSAAFGGPTPHVILAADTIVADAASKRRLRDATGADAVDLESGAVARVTSAHGLPCAAVRVICDPAERSLPPAALVALAGPSLRRPEALPRDSAKDTSLEPIIEGLSTDGGLGPQGPSGSQGEKGAEPWPPEAAHGVIGFGRVLASIVARPAQLPALLVLAADAARARRALMAYVATKAYVTTRRLGGDLTASR